MTDWLEPALNGIDSEIAEHEARIRDLKDIRSKLAGEYGTGNTATFDRVTTPAAPERTRRPRAMTAKAPALKSTRGRRMTEEGRRSLSEAMKARWAKRKKTGHTTL